MKTKALVRLAALFAAGTCLAGRGADSRPETWYHIIGGNATKAGLTADLEALKSAGMGGIQFFHGQFGKAEAWDGVPEQIPCLSAKWDGLVRHAALECARLGLTFKMQNCPGWSMSGGPWIAPSNAMRKLVFARREVATGPVPGNMAIPAAYADPDSDWHDVCLLAFPTPEGDVSHAPLKVARVEEDGPSRLISFASPVTIRTLELPPPRGINRFWTYNPDAHVSFEAKTDKGWVRVCDMDYPQGCWQDTVPLSLACDEATATKWRLTISSSRDVTVNHVRFYSHAALDNWEGLSGHVLRGQLKRPQPRQEAAAYIPANGVRVVRPGDVLPGGSRWTILRIGHVNMKKKNAPAPAEATGWECDKLDPRGIEVNFAAYIGRLAKGPLAGGLLKGMVVDSWECERQTWTWRMEEYFRTANGYDVRTILPAVFGWVIESPAHTERLLLDWRRTVSGLITKNYYGRMAELAHGAGLSVAYETAFGDVVPGDLLEFWKYCDTPMCEFWQPYTPATGSVGHPGYKPVRPCVSAAHLYGKPRVACESFTNTKLTWDENFRDLKEQAVRHFARGVTHLVFHTCTHNPQTDGRVPGTSFGSFIGTPFIRGETWWSFMRPFTDWIAACTAFLERGKPRVDVLRYLGDELDHKPDELEHFPEGYKNDYLNHDVLMNRLDVRDGRFVLPDGMSYSTLWVPPSVMVLPETQARLDALAEKGGHIVRGTADAAVVGLKPQLTYVSAEPGREAQLLWYSRLDGVHDCFFVAADEKGFRGTACFRTQHGERTLALDLAPYETLLLEFGPEGVKDLANPKRQLSAVRRQLVPASCELAPWRLGFPSGWGAPESLALTNLVAWKDLPGVLAEGRAFSGTARYATTLRLESVPATPLCLDLGVVRDFARVCVNGREVAALWAWPYRCDIQPHLRQGDNDITVEVTSTWFNRLAYDFNQAPSARKTWTIWNISGSPPPCLTPNAALRESGLLGPVRLLTPKPVGEVVLAARGQSPAYTIVLPPQASASQRYAAEELRDWTERLTGVRLPIASAGVPGRRIMLGGEAPQSLGTDGFRLHVANGDVHVVGSAVRGTLYGVYELLETYGGIGWFASFRTVVPHAERLAVPSDLDRTEVPAFAMRETLWYDSYAGDHAARLRLTGNSQRLQDRHGGHSFRFGGGLRNCHTFAQLVPAEKYGKSHPEYYAMRDGKRVVDLADPQRTMQLCLTNPDVLEIVITNVFAAIRRDPTARYYGVSQNDNQKFCTCPSCAKIDAEEGSHAGSLVRFVNAVAAAVAREFPGKIIETLAYQYTRKPPKKTRLLPNVMPCLCTIECDFGHPISSGLYRENIAFRQDIRGWAAQTDQLYIWDYTTDFGNYLTAFPNVYVLQDNLRLFRAHGVTSMFEQGAYQGAHGDFGELKTWLLAKWMWNPDLPMKPLLDRFFTGYYGKAAPYVRQYFEELHALVRDNPRVVVGPWFPTDSPLISDEFLLHADELWRQAAAAVADDPECAYAVRMGALVIDYMRFTRLQKSGGTLPPFMVRRRWQTTDEQRTCAELAQRVLDRVAEQPNIYFAEGRGKAKHLILAKLKDAVDLASWKGFSPSDQVVLEESAGRVYRAAWGGMAADATASGGQAMKLANTHYEWAYQLPLPQAAFDAGARYRVRMRVKVVRPADQAQSQAQAFSAGIYDAQTKKSLAGISKTVAAVVTDQWQWYDVGTWTPGPGQYLWLAPGRFDKKAHAANPALEAIWLDQLEISRAE